MSTEPDELEMMGDYDGAEEVREAFKTSRNTLDRQVSFYDI